MSVSAFVAIILVVGYIVWGINGFLIGRNYHKIMDDGGTLEIIEQENENTEILLHINSDIFFKTVLNAQYVTLKVRHRKL